MTASGARRDPSRNRLTDWPIASALAFAPALALLLAACGDESDASYVPNMDDEEEEVVCEEAEPELPASNIFQVQGQFEDIDYWNCLRPAASEGAFTIDEVTGTEATVTGSTADFELLWSGPEEIRGRNLLFWVGAEQQTRIVNGRVVHAGVGRGYYRYVIPDDENPLNLQFLLEQEARGDEYQINFAIDDTVGDPVAPRIGSAIARRGLWLIEVGSGDIQINLNWNTLVDLDLHVTDPTGFEIYYAALESPSGGTLDLDSYPACNFANDRGRGNENVFWPIGDAPRGTYLVQVHMWSECGTYAAGEPTLYRATIVHGDQIEVVNGRFDPAVESSIDPSTHDVSMFTF